MLQRKDYLGYNGAIYKRTKRPEKDHLWRPDLYRKLECYLPCATGTYNETLEETFHRFCDQLELKQMRATYADGLYYQWDFDADKMVPVKKGNTEGA